MRRTDRPSNGYRTYPVGEFFAYPVGGASFEVKRLPEAQNRLQRIPRLTTANMPSARATRPAQYRFPIFLWGRDSIWHPCQAVIKWIH